MIRAIFGHSLRIFERVAADITLDDRATYLAMTGATFEPDDAAARLWLDPRPRRIWTFWETVGNFPAAVGGYVLERPGVWTSWFMSTPDAWKRGRQITEAVAACVRHMLEEEGAHRLETVTLATRTSAREWYERIGFSYESTARKASASGEDLVTYVAIRGD
jgi:RimJ/RimL family protein N-acetyltransferase